MPSVSTVLVEPLLVEAGPRAVPRGEKCLRIFGLLAAVGCALALSSVPTTMGSVGWQHSTEPAITMMQPARVSQPVRPARLWPALAGAASSWRGNQEQSQVETPGHHMQVTPSRQVQAHAFKGGSGSPFQNLVGKKQIDQSTIIGPSYNFCLGSAAITAALVGVQAPIPFPLFFGALSLLTGVQSGRVRFAFDRNAMEVLLEDKEGEIKQSGDNFETGTQNRWNYKTFTRWNFVPSESIPIFVYFYETETKGGDEEQFHLFPVIMDAKQLATTMKEKIGVDKMK